MLKLQENAKIPNQIFEHSKYFFFIVEVQAKSFVSALYSACELTNNLDHELEASSVFVTTSDVSFPHDFLSCLDFIVSTHYQLLSESVCGCCEKLYSQPYCICWKIWTTDITSEIPKYFVNIRG